MKIYSLFACFSFPAKVKEKKRKYCKLYFVSLIKPNIPLPNLGKRPLIKIISNLKKKDSSNRF